MNKANQNAITPTNRRRFLRLAATTAAAAAFLAPPALAKGGDDTRLLATIAKAHEAVKRCTETGARSHACYELVQVDPDKPKGSPRGFAIAERENGSTISERALMRLWQERTDAVYRRHGYDVAVDEWDAAGNRMRLLLSRVCPMRPRTVQGASAKVALFAAVLEADCWEAADLAEYGLPAVVADLERLARKAVTS